MMSDSIAMRVSSRIHSSIPVNIGIQGERGQMMPAYFLNPHHPTSRNQRHKPAYAILVEDALSPNRARICGRTLSSRRT